MRRPKATAVTWCSVSLAIGAWIAGLALLYGGPASEPSIPPDGLVWAAPFLALAGVGGVIIVRKPGNRIGWLLVGVSLLQGIGLLGSSVLRYAYAAGGSGSVIGWLGLAAGSLSVLGYGLLAVVLLTFPDGKLLSPAWRWLGIAVIVYLAAAIADVAVSPIPPLPGGLPVSPFANPALARFLDPLTSDQSNGLVYLAAASSLPFRYRSGDVVVRQQIKWFGFGVAILVAGSLLRALGPAVLGPGPSPALAKVVGTVIEAVALLGVPTAIGVAILRHRLFDIDSIISRALVYGALAVLATATYVVLVVGVGTLIDRTAGAGLLLSVMTTALVAIAFQPLRERLQAAANRLVYGRRQAPYEALTGFTRRLTGSYSVDEILPRMVEVIAEGLRCRAAAVLLDQPRGIHPSPRWPPTFNPLNEPPDELVEVNHQGDRHGSLAVWTFVGEELSANDQRVLSDLALQVGLVLHNARLSAELERRLDELSASRLRLVSAQDRERRRLERDLHDGAQHDLVALRMKLGLAESQARASNSPLAGVLSELREDTAATLETIRRLSRGLYPPLLESQGLAAALTAHARRVPVPVQVKACGDRFARDVETAIYFCCVEALQNAAKHAGADRASISIDKQDGRLCFAVSDDGDGFDPSNATDGSGLQNIRDRIDALKGAVEIQSGAPGTTIRGWVPATGSGRSSSRRMQRDEAGAEIHPHG